MTSGVLISGRFPVDIFCWVEQVDEIEAYIVFDVVAVGEELDVLYDGIIILSWFNSRVRFSVPSIQVKNVWASTDLKTGLPTPVYDFCKDDVNIKTQMSGKENIAEGGHSKDEEDDTCIEITQAADTM